jgi:hypothetical protein
MIINSKFSSLCLVKKEQWKAPHDRDVCYIQKFATGEEIRIQFTSPVTGFRAGYMDRNGNDTAVDVDLLYTDAGRHLFECVFSVDVKGEYTFYVTGSSFFDPSTFAGSGYTEVCGNVYAARFSVKPPDELHDTVLISYTHRRNEYDTEFTQRAFNFRVEGGIYPGDKTQALDNEVFRDQRFTAHQIAAETYEVSVLTIGTNRGVPQWVGNKINSIFKLSDVFVDGVKTVRNESSVPELIQMGTYYPLYVFKLKVEQSDEETVCASGACGVFVTFHGNNGETADGKAVVGVLIPSGTKWEDVPKPEFLKSGDPPVGFTFIQDDSAVIASSYVVSDDITVYALF